MVKVGKKEKKKEKVENKAFFSQRLMAFIIDFLIVTAIASIISFPFVDKEKNNKLSDEIMTTINSYVNEEITINEYLDNFTVLSYKIAKNSGIQSFVVIVLYVLYFVVYQLYAKGQTIGKKIMKIRIKSDNGDLEMNQMIFRSFISNFILMDILSFIFMLFSKNSTYFYSVSIVETIQCILVVISVFMIISRQDGRAVHDKMVHTRVVQV